FTVPRNFSPVRFYDEAGNVLAAASYAYDWNGRVLAINNVKSFVYYNVQSAAFQISELKVFGREPPKPPVKPVLTLAASDYNSLTVTWDKTTGVKYKVY
ncbi:hypothetical protein KIH86_19560, partial [Paenibacillus sp. HN-1]